MGFFMKNNKILLVCLVLVAVLSYEVEARRTILKGRRALNRTYYRESSIAAWAIVILVALGEVIAGVVLFFVMKRLILDTPITATYTLRPTEEEV